MQKAEKPKENTDVYVSIIFPCLHEHLREQVSMKIWTLNS